MRILIDISHPAHVHFFRNAIDQWRSHGHAVRVAARHKDITCDLLKRFGIPFEALSKASAGPAGWAWEMLAHTGRLFFFARDFKPHLMLQIGGTFVGPTGVLTNIPSWAFTDTENATLSNAVTFPLVDRIFTPACYTLNHGPKHRRYPGFHELAYLHPRRFSPEPAVPASLGLRAGEPFSIVRFVSWQSAHDLDQAGFTSRGKIELIRELARHGKVFVSSEAPLPRALKDYAGHIPMEQIHHYMARASLVAGESATMASEAAVLGTPAIFLSPTGRGYTDVQEHKYGLVFCFRPSEADKAIDRARDILTTPYPDDYWEMKRQKLLAENIDVTGWLVRMVEYFGETRDPDAAESRALEEVVASFPMKCSSVLTTHPGPTDSKDVPCD